MSINLELIGTSPAKQTNSRNVPCQVTARYRRCPVVKVYSGH